MDIRKLARGISAIGVILGITYLVMAFVAVIANASLYHAKYMLFGALLLFPYSVAVAYIASVARRPWPNLIYITLGVLLLYFTPLIAGSEASIPRFVSLLLTLSGVLGAISSFLIGRERTGAVRLSLYLVGLSMLGITLEGLVGLIRYHDIFTAGLALILGFPVPLIYAVTVNALPSTFKDKPGVFSAYMAVSLSILGSVLVGINNVNFGVYIGIISLIVYLYAARFHRLNVYRRRIHSMREGPAKAGLKYFVDGHIAVIASIIIVALYSLNLIVKCGTGCVIHELALGFVSLHVWIHGPMMLPVILGVRHKRRFNLSPFIILLGAMIVFPISHPFALALYTLSFIACIFIVV